MKQTNIDDAINQACIEMQYEYDSLFTIKYMLSYIRRNVEPNQRLIKAVAKYRARLHQDLKR